MISSAIRAAAGAGVPVHVLMNNNRSNYAVVNAFDFGALLGVPLPRPPQPIIDRLAERDGAVPAWVESAEPPALPPAGGSEAAGQGTLDLGD